MMEKRAQTKKILNAPDVFNDPLAQEINLKRMEHLESLGLPIESKKVLDVGCGVGYLSQFFVERSCQLLCVDARAENIQTLKNNYPQISTSVLDIESDSLFSLGIFDIVFCYGLLYHLENPVAALRKMASVCSHFMLLETLVTDHSLPLSILVDEPTPPNQALRGIGNRPTTAYVLKALKVAGFDYIYLPKKNPDHPDFDFVEKNNLDYSRNGHNLRRVFIASRSAIPENPNINLQI